MANNLDHQDVLDRPWLYNPNVYHLVASLALAQETIDQMRADLMTADEEIGSLQSRVAILEDRYE
jgi:uncharacterized Fe-S radical SAM superfamily protein PflX